MFAGNGPDWRRLAFPVTEATGVASMKVIAGWCIFAGVTVLSRFASADISSASCAAAQKYSAAHGGL
ncbi:MAG TPA: hypothetical protein VHS80_06635, partial [Chthoniobacterales bacterium]|nr:hypothetical protein [Chthoniobacterales bacterium]